ncbi:MAG: N-glycosylase/DNA lyase [Leptospirales bacterium]|nr:N-glycosylase/DNA lyase [Leptospirales bacterium]
MNNYNKIYEKEIIDLYKKIKPEIVNRISEFRKIWEEADNRTLFIELAFCLFTPQSSARQCWRAVNILLEKDLLFAGNWNDISREINIVRFRNNKSKYLIEARERFLIHGNGIRESLALHKDQLQKRAWLVKNIKGMGLKEGSHFLRNIGIGNDLAILDRHILKNMKLLNVIDDIPKSLTEKTYLSIEEKLSEYSNKVHIPMEHIDFVLWYKEAGEVFK